MEVRELVLSRGKPPPPPPPPATLPRVHARRLQGDELLPARYRHGWSEGKLHADVAAARLRPAGYEQASYRGGSSEQAAATATGKALQATAITPTPPAHARTHAASLSSPRRRPKCKHESFAGTTFACFTSASVQILTEAEAACRHAEGACRQPARAPANVTPPSRLHSFKRPARKQRRGVCGVSLWRRVSPGPSLGQLPTDGIHW